jgi:hypothetical protein
VSDALAELVLPRTDAGALVQLVVAICVFAPARWFVRQDRDLRAFVAGLATLTFAWFALRTVH